MRIGRHLAAVCLAMAAAAALDPPARAGEERGLLRFDRVLTDLDLTEEQRARVLGLRNRFEGEMGPLVELLNRRAVELRGRIEEAQGEPRAIEELVQEIGRVQTEMLRVRVRAIRDLREVLNIQQQSRLRVLEEKYRPVRGPAPAPR
jgi:Spy/CpxP family protein refolding chaperone